VGHAGCCECGVESGDRLRGNRWIGAPEQAEQWCTDLIGEVDRGGQVVPRVEAGVDAALGAAP